MSIRSFLPSLRSSNDLKEGDAFYSLHKEVDRLFNEFTRGFGVPAFRSHLGEGESRFSPRINVSETDTAIEISVELPGVEEDNIDVTLADDALTIKGEKQSEVEDKSKDYHLIERSYGVFRRSIPLPFKVAAESVNAKFDKGVLSISLPKPPEVEAKIQKIEIN